MSGAVALIVAMAKVVGVCIFVAVPTSVAVVLVVSAVRA